MIYIKYNLFKSLSWISSFSDIKPDQNKTILSMCGKEVLPLPDWKLAGHKCTFFFICAKKKCQNSAAGFSQNGYFGCIKPDQSR